MIEIGSPYPHDVCCQIDDFFSFIIAGNLYAGLGQEIKQATVYSAGLGAESGFWSTS